MHEFFVFSSGVCELGVIFLPSKFNFKVLGNFLCILISRSCVFVLTLLSLYDLFFCCDFLLSPKGSSWLSVSIFLYCNLSSCYIFNISSCGVIYVSDTFLIIKFLIGRDLIAWFNVDILWVVIFFFLFRIFLLFSASFLYLIYCYIALGITDMDRGYTAKVYMHDRLF